MIQFSYNSIITEITKVSFFYVNYGYESEIYEKFRKFSIFAQKIILNAAEFKKLHE